MHQSTGKKNKIIIYLLFLLLVKLIRKNVIEKSMCVHIEGGIWLIGSYPKIN